MVGYERGETLTLNQKLIAGCISGCVTRFVTQPFDAIKLRAQLRKVKSTKASVFRITDAIYRKHGFVAFWRGHYLGQVHSIVAVSVQFYTFELLTKLTNTDTKEGVLRKLIFGTISGCASCTMSLPFEVIRVRQILIQDEYKGLLRGARQVYKTGGILAFYGGLGPSLLQMGPAVGITFSVFTFIQELILEHFKLKRTSDATFPESSSRNQYTPQEILIASAFAGSCAGFASKTLTYPLDLTKRRMQIATHREKMHPAESAKSKYIKCSRLLECLSLALKKEGVLGLYRGWTVTIYKAQITSIVAFTSYELVCYCIREINLQR